MVTRSVSKDAKASCFLANVLGFQLPRTERSRMINQIKRYRILSMLLVAAIVIGSSGCIGAMAQLLYVMKGHKSPAEFDGLEGKRVAVVVVSDASAYGPDTLTYSVSKIVSMDLTNNVKNISVIPPAEIEKSMDTKGWDQTDFREVGDGLGAEIVVSVEIGSYTIHEGTTLYKGQSDLSVSVHDVESGQLLFSKGPNAFVFPENGRPAIQTNPRQFEQLYLAKLTNYVARLFYAHDRLDSVADDASMPF